MKLASLAFVLTLFLAHYINGWPTSIPQELSRFRDGPYGDVGYGLFALLFVIAVIMIAKLVERARRTDAGFFFVATILLIAVATTPSFAPSHNSYAFLLMLLLFGYYSMVLFSKKLVLFLGHLAALLTLLAVALHEKAGVGGLQKLLILYFLVMANVQYHLIAASAAARKTVLPRRARRLEKEGVLVEAWLRRAVDGKGDYVRLRRKVPVRASVCSGN